MTDPNESETISPILSPIADELARALQAVIEMGYGTITIRVERGAVKRISVKGNAIPNQDDLPNPRDCGRI